MNYQKITKFDTANGPGIRTVLWVSGCSHRCKGCHNESTWDSNSGTPFTSDTMREILDSLAPDYVAGLTISGGDPLFFRNRLHVSCIVEIVKAQYPNKSIWVWTGYLYEEVKDLELMNYIDVLVDGKFELDKRDITLKYRGSPNQRVIDITRSKQEGEIISWI